MKKIFIQLLGCLLAVSYFSVNVSAEDLSYNWTVTFNGTEHMDSTFNPQDIQQVIDGMQPGDNATFTITLANDSSGAADFWLDDMVKKSFEEGAVASKGAYTYTLQFIPNGGTPETIYTSEVVGGSSVDDKNVGLHEAVNAFGDDTEYIYLDQLPAKGRGVVRLYVELDGETQNNTYQNTLANLALRFAAELLPEPSVKPREEVDRIVRHEDRIVYLPNTGDESNVGLYVATFIGSLFLFVFAYLKLRKTTKEN